MFMLLWGLFFKLGEILFCKFLSSYPTHSLVPLSSFATRFWHDIFLAPCRVSHTIVSGKRNSEHVSRAWFVPETPAQTGSPSCPRPSHLGCRWTPETLPLARSYGKQNINMQKLLAASVLTTGTSTRLTSGGGVIWLLAQIVKRRAKFDTGLGWSGFLFMIFYCPRRQTQSLSGMPSLDGFCRSKNLPCHSNGLFFATKFINLPWECRQLTFPGFKRVG